MRIQLIGCEILTRELARAAADSSATVDLVFLPKALHDLGPRMMRERLQQAIDAADPMRHDVVVLGYALCGTGLAGLRAGRLPLVAPRAHDCISLLLGSARRYEQLVTEEPGTYFRSRGWVERAADLTPAGLRETGVGMSLADLIAKYGEDNGFYLYREFTRYQQNYKRLVYIRTSAGETRAEQKARDEAESKGWRFEPVTGDPGWFRRLAAGEWNDLADFVVAQPGQCFEARYDGAIFAAAAAKEVS